MTATKNWTGWGVLLSPSLPFRPLDLGPNVRLEKVSPERLQEVIRETPRVAHPKIPDRDHFSAIPGDRIVRSSWIVWFRVRADSADEAFDTIARRYVPAVVSALSAVASAPARVELLRVGATRHDGFIPEPESPWRGGRFGVVDVKELGESLGNRARELFKVFSSDDQAADLAERYAEAVESADLATDSSAASANVIANFFQVIEKISSVAPDPWSFDADAEASAERLLNKLASELAVETPLKTRISAVANATNELAKLQNRYLAQRIRRASDQLRVDDAHRDVALRMLKLRNTVVSHPGGPRAGLAAEIPAAEEATRAFLSAYGQSLLADLQSE